MKVKKETKTAILNLIEIKLMMFLLVTSRFRFWNFVYLENI